MNSDSITIDKYGKTKEAFPTDDELLWVYQNTGDENALATLYERFKVRIRGVCLKYFNTEQVEDVLQEIYLQKLFLKKNVRDTVIRNFSSWLCKVAENYCKEKLRPKKKEIKTQNVDIRIIENFPDDMEIDESIRLTKETLLQAMENCIEGLSHEQEKCIILFYLEQKCYIEIAENTGFDVKQVKSHIQNGKRNLENCIRKNKNE